MEKTLKLYIDENGVQTPFPSSDDQIEIGSFDYNARRMGGAPTISATVMWESCLDGKWTKSVYAEFNDERYYLKQTPTSSYNNTDLMYEHNLELVSERIALDNVYFYDAVSGTPQEGDKPVSHSADFVFFGTIDEFVGRLNASLEYAGMLTWEDGVDKDGNAIKVPKGYYVEVDEGIESEAKFISFSSQFMSNVLQEIYNIYELPYYFVGKTIHVGYTSNVLTDVFRYGVDDALLSITKNNANTKVVNRVTGIGSEENIPYYYPNDTPKACGVDVTVGDFEVQVIDGEALETNTKIGEELTFLGNAPIDFDPSFNVSKSGKFGYTNNWDLAGRIPFKGTSGMSFRQEVTLVVNGLYYANGEPLSSSDEGTIEHEITAKVTSLGTTLYTEAKSLTSGETIFFDIVIPSGYDNDDMDLSFSYRVTDVANTGASSVAFNVYGNGMEGWIADGWNDSKLSRELGLAITGTLSHGDTITVVQDGYINPQRTLMPSIYRESSGAERFYNATSYPFDMPDGYILKENEYVLDGQVHNDDYKGEDGVYLHFNSPYVEGRPVEQIVEFPDIKPTIKGVLNDDGLPIDEFLEFAFDINDNNEIDENENYIHSHFFAKLPRMPFNLFDHAIENGEMTVNMTGGSLGGCSFVIAVSEEGGDNTVQVDASGNLIRDDNGNVLCGVEGQGNVEPQPQQNDTRYNEVWIALKKDANYTTYARPTLDATAEDGVVTTDAGGTAIDGKEGHYLPYEGTTFVYTNILLPKSYITEAEERLKTALLDYLEENNVEKFNFSIAFSRIYLAEKDAEDEDFLRNLNENARITIEYNGEPFTLYVSSYSYKMTEGELLPEISIELSEDLTVSQNAIQAAISEVKGDLLNTIGNIDVLAQGTPYFLRKDQKDRAKKTIVFEEGIEVGDYNEGTLGSGAKISIGENGSSFIEADYLKIRKKATFTTLTVQEMKSVGGEIVVSPAAMVCSSVEELEDAYRCYFNTTDNGGKFIFNEFEVGDQARSQAFNVLGSRYYWRLVTAVGDDYIDLSKTDCDEGSDVPQAGDAIVSLGNRTNAERQSAIIHSAYGEYAPSMTQYAGIGVSTVINESTGEEEQVDPYSLENKIVTRFSPKGNLITGQLRIEAGTTGAENLNINVGASNLLRNSGFTGDYLSEPLADEEVMYGDKTLFSDPLDHWATNNIYPEEGTETIYVYVQDSTESASEKEVVFANGGVLSQELYYPTINGETYVLSFKAKGYLVQAETEESEAVYNTMSITIGSTTYAMMLSDVYERHSLKLVSDGGSTITFSCDSVTMCELQLERGNIASAWGNSFMDNASDRTYWQSMKYLQNAIEEGSTTTNGGLVLTKHIKVGNYVDKEMVKETAGVSGVWNNDNDVVFWAGGSHAQATSMVDYYDGYENREPPTDLSSYAKFVVTHGGRAILNDMILRGYIYALGGKFKGELEALSGKLGANTTIEDDIIKTNAIELSDYVVYKYKNIQDVCNNGVTSSSYELPQGAPSFMYFAPSEHQMGGASLIVPMSYEAGRSITIVSSPITTKNDGLLTLEGSFYLSEVIDVEGAPQSRFASSLTLRGGKIELYYDGLRWMVLSPISSNILINN